MSLFQVEETAHEGVHSDDWLELRPTDALGLLITPDTTNGELLDLSIKKWEFIVEWLEDEENADRIDDLDDCGGLTCALCLKYMDSAPKQYCKGCPIALAGHPGCGDTPYGEFHDVGENADRAGAARKEIVFLQKVKEEHGKV
jgi:hypothetical protein